MSSSLKRQALAELNVFYGKFSAFSRTKLTNGSFRTRRCVLFCSSRISNSAPDPRRFFVPLLPPPSAGFAFRAAFVASSLRGAFPPVDFVAVCFVRAIVVVLDGADVKMVRKKF